MIRKRQRTGQLLAWFLTVVLATSFTACKPEQPVSSDGMSSASSSGDSSTDSNAPSDSTTDPGMDPIITTATVITNPQPTNFVIAENSVAKATIVIPQSPTDKVREAAEDLQAHLKKMTGSSIKIGFDNVDRTNGNFILVGPTAQTKALGIEQPTGYPGAERVIVRREKNYLVLLGNDDGEFYGTQFAVNMFLEQLGCGWFGPDELWQVIPDMKTVAIDQLNIDHTPAFTARLSNVWYNYKKFSRRWYQGGEKKIVGHAIPQLIPRETYYATHPEWFAEVDGRRDPYAAFYWQYCYTNEALAQEAGKKIIEIFDKDPNLTQYAIGANDGWEQDWCECSACSKLGNDTDELLTFANNVAKVVAKKYPDKKLTILSYHSIYFAPTSGIKAEPNVEVMFCRETSMTVPLDLNLAIPNGFNAITHNTYTQSWLANFKEYVQKTSLKNKAIWEWHCLAADKAVWAEIPWVQGNVSTRNQKLWKDLGVSYIYYDQGPSPTYHETEKSFAVRWPLWYVSSKGMWDSSLTGEQILRDACNKLFGCASAEMFAYYKALADSSEQCHSTSTICWVPPNPQEIYTAERIQVIDQTIMAAKNKLSSVTDEQRKRMENQIQYWENAKPLIKYGA